MGIGQYEEFIAEGGNWEACSHKDGANPVSVSSMTEYRYGKMDAWVYKWFMPGSKMKCSADSFGDPAPDKTKCCEKRMDTKGEHWRPCAADTQICKGPADNHKVRYGADGKYNYME